MTVLPKRILILDNNEDILEMVEEAMLSEGYHADSISSTNDIISSVRQYQPDLVLIDYLLPRINGGELCHQIKTNTETAHIPVVMLSAYPRVLESLGNYGSDAFIAKPFSLAELTRTVKDMLRKFQHKRL